MGYYIEVEENLGKTEQIVKKFDGQEIGQPAKFSDIPAGKALVVVVSNGLFDAAAFAYSEMEFNWFVDQRYDPRPRRFVLIGLADAIKASGIPARLTE